MPVRRAFVVLIIALAAVHGSWSAAQGVPPGTPPAVAPGMLRQLQAEIDSWADTPGHRGVSASVILGNGAQWSGTAGHSGEASLRDDHLIAIASITKTMTAAIILQLVDEGVIRLDDPIGRWLAPRRNVDPAITVRQLLNHTNGLANYTGTASLGAAINTDPARVFAPNELLAFVGPRRFAPGTDTEYTNTSFLLLGLIAQSATGRSIEELYHRRLWEPLGLTEIFLPGFEDAPSAVAMAYSGATEVSPLDRMSLISIGHSAFGLFSNARTVARWGHALFCGNVISVEMQSAMRVLEPAAGNIPGESGSGLGIRAYQYLDRTQFGHSGGATTGSSLLLHDPETGVTVAVIMNQGTGADHFVLAPRLLDLATRQ